MPKMHMKEAAGIVKYCWARVFGKPPPVEIINDQLFVDRTFYFYREGDAREPWCIDEAIHIPATREDPADVDVVTICDKKGLFPALRILLDHVADDIISNVVNDEAHAHWLEHEEKNQ